MDKIDAARIIINSGACFGVPCKDCPAHRTACNDAWDTDDEDARDRRKVQWFKDYLAEKHHLREYERIITMQDTKIAKLKKKNAIQKRMIKDLATQVADQGLFKGSKVMVKALISGAKERSTVHEQSN